MGHEYFATLDKNLDMKLGLPLLEAIEHRFGLVTLSRSSTELRLQTPENAAIDWEAVKIAIAPRQIYVLFSGGLIQEEQEAILQFISQWLSARGVPCQLAEE